MDWVPPRSICDMMTISFRGLGSSIRGCSLWQIACVIVSWIVWQERNARIFAKWRAVKMLWDLLNFYTSLWASCNITFRFVNQMGWILVLRRCLPFFFSLRGLNLYLRFSLYSGDVYSLFDQLYIFRGEDPSSFSYTFFIINISLVSNKKKTNC